MSESTLSKKLNAITAFLHPNATNPQILSANAQLNALIKDVKALEEENTALTAKVQELESGK